MLAIEEERVTTSERGTELFKYRAMAPSDSENEFSQWLLSQPHSEAKDLLLKETLLTSLLSDEEMSYYQMAMEEDLFLELLSSPLNDLPIVSTTEAWYQYQSENHFYVDFAHPTAFGGGFRSFGNVQEETLFVEFPALAHLAFLTRESPIRCINEENDDPTPFLVPDCKRSFQLENLYGSLLEKTPLNEIRAHIKKIASSPCVNILGMSAKNWSSAEKRYDQADLRYHLKMAFLAFEGAHLVYSPTVIHTGAWGCGVYLNSEKMMTLIQMLAATLARTPIIFEGVNLAHHPYLTSAFIDEVKGMIREADTAEELLERVEQLQESDPSWAPHN